MIIIIPLVPPSLNQFFGRGHWSKRNKLVKLWDDIIWKTCLIDNIKPVKGFPVTITTKVYSKGRRKKDTSNMFPANKLAEDALVRAGILPDDTIEYVNRHIVEVPEFGCKEDKTIISID